MVTPAHLGYSKGVHDHREYGAVAVEKEHDISVIEQSIQEGLRIVGLIDNGEGPRTTVPALPEDTPTDAPQYQIIISTGANSL